MAIFVQNRPYIGPFHCFGIYLSLQLVFFTCAYMMNQNMEPGDLTSITDTSSSEGEEAERLLGQEESL